MTILIFYLKWVFKNDKAKWREWQINTRVSLVEPYSTMKYCDDFGNDHKSSRIRSCCDNYLNTQLLRDESVIMPYFSILFFSTIAKAINIARENYGREKIDPSRILIHRTQFNLQSLH